MEFTLAGKRLDLTPSDVLKKLKGVAPEMIRVHSVIIRGQRYPVKQVLSIATGVSRADFTSHQAYQLLRRLGLDVRSK